MIKNTDLLEETSKVSDLLNITEQVAAFSNRLATVPRSSIIALVGPFGVGKSTMLYQIMQSQKDTVTWIEFDAWKYPNRDNLWEGFVLDVAESAGKSDLAVKKIDGKSTKSAWVDIVTDVVSILSDKLEGIDVLDKFTSLFKASPATRVFELQAILKTLIEVQENDLVIVVEDIDRSGDSGVFFLETLKHFLRTVKLSRRVIVVVPIANQNYFAHIDSYLKSVDFFDFLETKEIKLDNFVTQVFEEELFQSEKRDFSNHIVWTGSVRKLQTISFLEALFKEMPSMNLRLLKLILRKSNVVYNKMILDGHEPDFRVVLCIESSKYFKKTADSNETYFDEFKRLNFVSTGNVFSIFLSAMVNNKSSLYVSRKDGEGVTVVELLNTTSQFKFVSKDIEDGQVFPYEPWSYRDHYEGFLAFSVLSTYLKY